MEYGTFIFSTFNHSLFAKFGKIQLKALRLVLRLRGSTSNNIVLNEAGEPPIQIRFKLLSDRFISRNLAFSDNALIDKLSFFESHGLSS